MSRVLIGDASSASGMGLCASMIGVIVAFAASVSAQAASIDRSGEPQLRLGVVGHIAQSCSLGAMGAAHIQDLSKTAEAVSSSMPIHCNVPFQLNISSDNGGLVNAAGGQGGVGGWGGRVGYSLKVGIPVLYPTGGVVQGVYNARDLTSGKALSSNGGVAFDKVYVELKTEVSSGPGLLAGDYADVIRFSVAPQV